MPPRTSTHHVYAHNTTIKGPQAYTTPVSKPINLPLYVGVILVSISSIMLAALALIIIFQNPEEQVSSHWMIITGFINLVLLVIGAIAILSFANPIPRDSIDAKALNNRLRG